MSSKPFDHDDYDPSRLGSPLKATLGILAAMGLLGLLLFGSITGIVYGVHRMRLAARQAPTAPAMYPADYAANAPAGIQPASPAQEEARRSARMETPVANLQEAVSLAQHGDETDYRRVIVWMAGAEQRDLGSPEENERLAAVLESRGDEVSPPTAALGEAMIASWRRRGTPADITPAPPATDALATTPEPTAPQVTAERPKTATPAPTGPLSSAIAEQARRFGASLRRESTPSMQREAIRSSLESPYTTPGTPTADDVLRRARERHRLGSVPLTTPSSNTDKIIAEMRERHRKRDEEHERRMEEYRARDRERFERALHPDSYPPLYPPRYPR